MEKEIAASRHLKAAESALSAARAENVALKKKIREAVTLATLIQLDLRLSPDNKGMRLDCVEYRLTAIIALAHHAGARTGENQCLTKSRREGGL